jgi:hypothetical protein
MLLLLFSSFSTAKELMKILQIILKYLLKIGQRQAMRILLLEGIGQNNVILFFHLFITIRHVPNVVFLQPPSPPKKRKK